MLVTQLVVYFSLFMAKNMMSRYGKENTKNQQSETTLQQ